MNYIHVYLILSLAGNIHLIPSLVQIKISTLSIGFQLATTAPTEERNEFFGNVDYQQVVGHMKELMMYLPVLMTTVKETMTGFPKITEGLNTMRGRRFSLGCGRDGKCKCKQIKNEAETDEGGDS